MPRILDRPMNSKVGIMICIGSTAGAYAWPPVRKEMLWLANNIKKSISGRAIRKTKCMALPLIRLNSRYIFCSI